jgi:uncharacterized protein (DUF1015 family)
VHPIASAWITTGGTGAQNYDEFADETEITRIIESNPNSALAIEMPHFAPSSLGRSFTDALPDAAQRLEAAKRDGLYRAERDVVVLYRITSTDSVAYGLWCMVDTDQISTSADEPGLVIRNEDVFPEKVRERVALAGALGHLLSPVLLLQTGRGDELHEALAKACAESGAPDSIDLDAAGRTHEIWVKRDSGELTELAGGGELVVADGNHRSLAAQTGGLPRFLAVVTTPGSVKIAPYNRLVRDTGWAGGPGGEGVNVRVYTRAGGLRQVALPRDPALPFVDNLDHAVVERELIGRELGLEAGDKRITYVGGDYPDAWLIGEVDAGRADLAILIDPVTVPDFIEVNLARRKMPRKSTWFTPKARAGLVLTEL